MASYTEKPEGREPPASTFSKDSSDHVPSSDHAEHLAQVHTYYDREDIDGLSPEHKDYLVRRHGTLDLDPVPDMNDADPYNWPNSKKVLNLTLVAFHAMMATFTAASIQSAFENIAEDLGTTLQQTSYLTSLQIVIIGVVPLLWRPLSDRYGRRPIFLISLLCSMAGNIGCGFSYSYATQALCRAIVAFFICPAAAIGSAVVAETFFKKDRARYMGIWTLMVTLGVPVAPFLMGFVAKRVDYRWIYYILAITNAIQFILYLFLGPESRYLRHGTRRTPSTYRHEFFTFQRINPTPLTLHDFLQPLTFAARPSVLLPAIIYAMIFLFGAILISVELPQLFTPKFGLDAQGIGLQYVALIIGSVLGEQLGGITSDAWMARRARALNRRQQQDSPEQGRTAPRVQPEFRLWLSHPGHILTLVGTIVFLIQTQRLSSYNVTPVIGAAIASAGNQIVTTVMITYAVDCYREEAAGVGVFITLVRQTWAFIGPFWLPVMFETIGLYASAGVAVALILGVSVVGTVLLQLFGARWR